MLESLEPKLRSAKRVKTRGEYIRILDLELDYIFQHLPKRTKTRTQMSRKEFDEKYGNMHRTDLWKLVVANYHENTGDPMSKSDAFLEVMHTITTFDEQLETSDPDSQ